MALKGLPVNASTSCRFLGTERPMHPYSPAVRPTHNWGSFEAHAWKRGSVRGFLQTGLADLGLP